MKLKNLKQNILRFAGNYFLYIALNFLCKSLRFKIVNEKAIDSLIQKKQKFILAFWHGTMLYPWFYHRNKKLLGLTSQSKDGDLLAKILKRWNYNVVRGSSSKGGEIALGIMIDYAKHEGSVAITPDGPKGPRHKLKAGAVITAKKSNTPLVLLGVGYKSKNHLNNWDSFEIPKPFSKVKLIYSDPIEISSDLNYEETSKKIHEAEEKLKSLQHQAENFEN